MDTWLEQVGLEQVGGSWEVCGDCRRAYQRGECHRVWALCEETGEEELLQLCPYEGCEASPRFDGIDWSWLAHAHPDSLPYVPERGVVYQW